MVDYYSNRKHLCYRISSFNCNFPEKPQGSRSFKPQYCKKIIVCIVRKKSLVDFY